MLEEKRYRELAHDTLNRVMDAFDDVDVDDADVESTGDVIKVRFRDGSHCVLNTQTPARQLWLAAQGTGWHFDYDEDTSSWVDDKGRNETLESVLTRVVSEATGVKIDL